MKKNLKIFPVFFLTLCARLVPFNWIIGSVHATFSMSSMVAPVIAQHYGLSWVSLFFLSISIFSTSSLLLFFVHRTPLLFASRAFQKREITTSIILPAICMILFVSHDVGHVAWCYSLYWLIPMALFFTKDCKYSRALGASFVAHGVGSVVWLYTHAIPAPIWIGLMPVVLCERLLIAGGIIAFDHAVTCLKQLEFKHLFFTALKGKA